MKRIHIFSFIILVTLFFFSRLHAFGESPCQTEREAVNSAEEERDDAKKTVRIIKLEIGYILFLDDSDAEDRAEDLEEALERLEEAKKVLEEKEEALKRAKNARDVCLAYAYRTCGCSVSHTESLTSCSCDHKVWNGWCHCPARSS